MEILNVRLDMTESIKPSHTAMQGAKGTYRGEESFSMVLDKALKSASGAQERTETQTKPAESAERAETVKTDTTSTNRVVSDKKEEATRAAESTSAKASEEKSATVEDAEKSAVAEGEKGAESGKEKAEISENFGEELDSILARVLEDADKGEKAAENESGAKVSADTEKNATIVQNVSLFGDNAEADALEGASAEDALALKGAVRKKAAAEESENVPLFVQSDKDALTVAAAGAEEAGVDAIQKTANGKKNDAPLFTVIDERSINEAEAADGDAGSVRAVGSAQNAADANTTQMELSLSEGAKTAFSAASDGTSAVHGKDSAFASMLSSEIKANTGDFVKNGMITLRDNNRGTINLVLHPEELGNVKIRLELSDSIITGRIIVASEEAYGAFKDNIESLRQAFLSQGFDNAGFELSWAGSENGSEQNGQNGGEKNPRGFLYEEGLPLASGTDEYATNAIYGATAVNVVV